MLLSLVYRLLRCLFGLLAVLVRSDLWPVHLLILDLSLRKTSPHGLLRESGWYLLSGTGSSAGTVGLARRRGTAREEEGELARQRHGGEVEHQGHLHRMGVVARERGSGGLGPGG
jgi:hypothetical protein